MLNCKYINYSHRNWKEDSYLKWRKTSTEWYKIMGSKILKSMKREKWNRRIWEWESWNNGKYEMEEAIEIFYQSGEKRKKLDLTQDSRWVFFLLSWVFVFVLVSVLLVFSCSFFLCFLSSTILILHTDVFCLLLIAFAP